MKRVRMASVLNVRLNEFITGSTDEHPRQPGLWKNTRNVFSFNFEIYNKDKFETIFAIWDTRLNWSEF
jgi:hypothetical protein